MAEMTIQLRTNTETGKKDIIVSLKSDDDSMPHEHEQQHKQLVEKLIEGGTLSASEVGQIVVVRDAETEISEPPAAQPASDQRQSQSE